MNEFERAVSEWRQGRRRSGIMVERRGPDLVITLPTKAGSLAHNLSALEARTLANQLEAALVHLETRR